ncbi:MAG: hypothetical protein FJ146_11180 [Deltaproteobacteria bacterium]|nr:hypothetical protein [Deltaproteobacteria bacterium]
MWLQKSNLGSHSALALMFLVIGACAHHDDVRPSTTGVHLVVTKGEEREVAYRSARAQAECYCDEFDKLPFIVSESTAFVGEGGEKEYLRQKRLANAAKVGGTAGAIFMPSKGLRAASGIATVAGQSGDAYLGEQYRIRVKFRCK